MDDFAYEDAHNDYLKLKYDLIYRLGEINKLLQKYNLSNEDFSKVDETFQNLIVFIETAREL